MQFLDNDNVNNETWNHSTSIDWMDHIDNTFTDPEHWHLDLQTFDNANGTSSYDTIDSTFAPSDFVDNRPEAQTHQSTDRADSHQNSPPKKFEPESAIAVLSRLSQRLYSLYSAVFELANAPDAIDQADTAALRKGPFADDTAFQTLTGWLVRASSNPESHNADSVMRNDVTSTVAHDGCALLENVFSASQGLLDILHSLSGQASQLCSESPDSTPLVALGQQSTRNASEHDRNPHSNSFGATNQWSDSITRHMVMANHMLLLNTYLAVVMALQHAVNKQKSANEVLNAQDFALPLGEMRTAMVVQMCGYLIERQVHAVDAYLAPASVAPLSDSNPSDRTTMKALEKDVQRRLAQLKESLPV
ncbi:hypothetical protein QM012_002556 [Aureobasidium pullulans]|uniref:Aflatoxin regulatory protein domain-containing protein n=1 Tax=Aureobasidium pullulans TaxID=5580 RepID=A0ABR0TB64_AURPU